MGAGERRDEPSLSDLIVDLWRARLWLLGGVAAGLIGVALMVALCIPQYRATMIVGPAMRTGAPDISALFPAGANSSMQYMMQNIGNPESSDFMRFEAILRETTVAGKLLRDEKIRAGLAEAGSYRIFRHTPPDTPEKLAAWLQDNLVVDPVSTTRLKRLVLLHPDPAFAAYMLHALWEADDGIIRAEERDKAASRVAWLRRQLDTESNPDHKRAIANLLTDQEQVATMLSADEPYAAIIAEPPSAGARPYWPRKAIMAPLFVLVGMFAGYVLYGLRRGLMGRA
jgi:hypothetical protein